MLGTLKARKGVRVQGPLVALVANGVAGALLIFQVSNYARQVGVRTFRIERIKGLNAVAPPANTLVYIGTGGPPPAAWVNVMPPIATIAGMNFDFAEGDLPEVEVTADLYAYAVATAAEPDSVFIQLEVEELG